MKIYLDNCCYNRPFDEQTRICVRLETIAKLTVQLMMAFGKVAFVWSKILRLISLWRTAMTAMTMSDNELGVKCMNVLIAGVGPVEAERFISIVNREHFDYTEWQKNLFAGETVRSLGAKVMAFQSA